MYQSMAEKKANYQMLGYTSTSKRHSEALKFATEDVPEGQTPVLFRIDLENETGRYLFNMNSEEYTMYPEEEEVLIQ